MSAKVTLSSVSAFDFPLLFVCACLSRSRSLVCMYVCSILEIEVSICTCVEQRVAN